MRYDSGVERTLSPRQRAVLTLLAKGKSNREIAAALQLTVGTTRQYLYAIFRRLEVPNRTAAAVWWLEHRDAY